MRTIRKSVNRVVAEKIPDYIGIATNWLKGIYPDVNFDNVDYIFSNSYNRSRYFRNASKLNDKYLAPTVCISTRPELYLYDKKSLGMTSTMQFVGTEVQVLCALIHELTHHVQYEQNVRKGNELDTTRNELNFLKENYPSVYQSFTR